jgi:hypothetical protein
MEPIMSKTHRHVAASFNSRIAASLAALGTVALMAGASSAGASDLAKTKTTYISLDGYCDVLTLTVFAWHQAGEYDTSCDGINAVGSGMEGLVTGVSPKDLTIGETYFGDTGSSYLWNIQYPLATGSTWSIYKTTDGINFTYVNSGTYTIVHEADARAPHAGPAAHSGVKTQIPG